MFTVLRVGALALAAAALGLAVVEQRPLRPESAGAQASPQTPIQFLVVIEQEGASLDHYFGTYPIAANPPGGPAYAGPPYTPAVNGLDHQLLTENPNLINPFRLDRSQAYTCQQSDRYDAEQKAYDGGAADRFVESVTAMPSNSVMYCPLDARGQSDVVMGYFDGNTVTALWNYAQHFATSDNYFATTFGPSTVGALHLASADTSGALCGPQAGVYGGQPACGAVGDPSPDSASTRAPTNGSTGTVVAESDPFWDSCARSDASRRAALSGQNIGDLLDGAGVSWGWFQGGFDPAADGACDARHSQVAYDAALGIDPSADPNVIDDYNPAHEPFQFFASTANPRHLPPLSVALVGHDDEANHQYDLSWFWQAADTGNLPSVSFIKAPAYQTGRPGSSNPLDEQRFLVQTINRLQQLPQWGSMAVILTWDDSGGWYDHVAPRNVSQSNTPLDFACGMVTSAAPARCGYGPRLPILAISPYAKQNYVSHALIDQTSITRFVEDNWLGGQRLSPASFDRIAGSLVDLFDFTQSAARPLILDPASGEPGP